MSTLSSQLADHSSIVTRLRTRRARTDPAYVEFARYAQQLIAAGRRPSVRAVVTGIDGLSVRVAIFGLPGTILHARTRRSAREAARGSIAAALQLDPFEFDLEVDGG
jgi:hypothetical protein